MDVEAVLDNHGKRLRHLETLEAMMAQIYGWDGSAWQKLVADASGVLEVQQTMPADMQVGTHGWDGAAWRKLPMLWGFSERWAENYIFTAEGAGSASGGTIAIDPGYIYVLQAVSGYHDAGANKWVQLALKSGTVTPLLVEHIALPSGENLSWHGGIVLKDGDTVTGWCGAPGDGKSLFMHVWGYKMRVSE